MTFWRIVNAIRWLCNRCSRSSVFGTREIMYGRANLQLRVPVQRTTKFQLASVAKVFSIVALLKLEQDGKLNVDDPVSKYLSGLPKQWTDIKLRELATRTSGLPDNHRQSQQIPLGRRIEPLCR